MKGKNGAATSARLRTELSDIEAERNALRRELGFAKSEIEELRKWKTNAQTSGLPLVEEERQRANKIEARYIELLDAERQKWEMKIARASKVVGKIIKFARPDSPFGTREDMILMADLFGEDFGKNLPDTNRTIIRNTRNATNAKRALKMSANLKKMGLDAHG